MIIYKITNNINNKIYIGQTVNNLTKRFTQHCSAAKQRRSKSSLHNAILKYGKQNFSIEQIDYATNLDDLNNKEIEWIRHFNCMSPNGYNIHPGGDNHKLGADSIEKMRSKINSNSGPKSASKYKGVSPYKEKFKAQIHVNGKSLFLGYYLVEEEAALAYDKAVIKHRGSGYLNFPNLVK